MFINKKIFTDPLYLNKANPFPIFSSAGRYDFLTKKLRSEAIKLLNDDELYVKLLNSEKYENIFKEIRNIDIDDSFKSSKKYKFGSYIYM